MLLLGSVLCIIENGFMSTYVSNSGVQDFVECSESPCSMGFEDEHFNL